MSKVIENSKIECPDRADLLVMEHQAKKGLTIRCANEQFGEGKVTKGHDYTVIRGREDGTAWDEAEILDDEGNLYVAHLNPDDQSVQSEFCALFRIVNDDAFADNK